MIIEEHTGDIRVLRIQHGKANAFDLGLVRELAHYLEGPQRERALVLTGTERIFSAGVDLAALLGESPRHASTFLAELDALIRTLFDLPLPVVAALTGHTIAGGCLIAAACDYRVMGQGRIGVTEALVGLPIPPAGLEALRFLVGPRTQALVHSAATLSPSEALPIGLIDEIAAPDDVLPRAIETAQKMAAAPRQTFALHKKMLRSPALERIHLAQQDFATQASHTWEEEEPRRCASEYLARIKTRNEKTRQP